MVNIWEYLVVWRGKRQELRKVLRSATTYEKWKKAAINLDKFMNKDEWKEDPQSRFYDTNLIQNISQQLRDFRTSDAVFQLKDVLLKSALKQNLGSVENRRLYSFTYHGTKKLIEDYYAEIEESLKYIRNTKILSLEQKFRFFKRASKLFGTTCLCLSGGATFGFYHFGVIKALMEKQLLPNVITGTSAGAMIASIIAIRTDEEIRNEVLTPEFQSLIKAPDETIWKFLKRFITEGVMFDADAWEPMYQRLLMGDMTFMEAFMRTGRVLNITVTSDIGDKNPAQMLNYITAPDCIIWSAVMASCSIPGIIRPVVLLAKAKDGSIIPFNHFGKQWRDGSFRTDVPIRALRHIFGVSYTIVSQVNPHVFIFFYERHGSVGRPTSHRSGKGWRGGFLGSSIEHFLKLDMLKWLRILRDFQLLPKAFGQDVTKIFLQRFDGTVTILPKIYWKDFLHLLSDPTHERLIHYSSNGERRTWPKIHMIHNRMRIENLIKEGRESMKHVLGNGNMDTLEMIRIQREKAKEFEALENGSSSTNIEVCDFKNINKLKSDE